MSEGSQVSRKVLFNLSDKITRYFNHWMFLEICLVKNVIEGFEA